MWNYSKNYSWVTTHTYVQNESLDIFGSFGIPTEFSETVAHLRALNIEKKLYVHIYRKSDF